MITTQKRQHLIIMPMSSLVHCPTTRGRPCLQSAQLAFSAPLAVKYRKHVASLSMNTPRSILQCIKRVIQKLGTLRQSHRYQRSSDLVEEAFRFFGEVGFRFFGDVGGRIFGDVGGCIVSFIFPGFDSSNVSDSPWETSDWITLLFLRSDLVANSGLSPKL